MVSVVSTPNATGVPLSHDACRTPRGIGKQGKGALSHLHPQHLGATVLRALQERHGFDTADVDDVVWDTAAAVGDSPLRALETKELGERIQAALDRLPEEYSLLLLLVADEKLSYEEVGQLTDQTADAVRGKLHRARKAFRGAFEETL